MKLGEGDGVRKSLLKLIGIVAGLTLSATISAVGMGGIRVTTGLGQPLNAEIELVAISKAEKASLVARLATPEVYKSTGLDYPYGSKFKFQIESRADGEPYLKVTSVQPINDPFVVMLVELTWSSGKLLREYTFLLDPPGYVAELPVQSEVQPVAPAVQSVPAGMELLPGEPPAPPAVVQSIQQGLPSVSSSPVPIAAPAAEGVAVPSVEQGTPVETTAVPENIAVGGILVPNEEWLEVHRGDTLSKISAQYKLADVSLERMLVALYRANFDEFDGKNMNRIKAGKILRLPNQKEVEEVGHYEAIKEIRAHVADWNAYRQKLAGAASRSSKQQVAEQIATGKLASSVEDKAPVAKDSAKEVLRLSRGEAPGDKAATGGGKDLTAQDKKGAAQEDAIAAAKAAKEDQARIAMLEKNIQEMQRLLELKSQAAALAQQPPVAATAVAPASSVKPAPVTQPKSAPIKQEPTLIDQMLDMLEQVLGEPLYLAWGVGLLIVLGGLGWFVKQLKKKPFLKFLSKFSENSGTQSTHIATPAVSSPETGDFTGMAASQGNASDQSLDADPISEADLFLNFGRDAQAEEILKDALQSTPNNHLIHLKLLEIYANRKDLSSFENITRQLQDSGDEDATHKAISMGRELDPSNPLYGGSGAKENTGMQAPVFDSMPRLVSGDASTSKAASVDFNLDVPAKKPALPSGQDFMADAGQTVVMLSPEAAAKQGGEMDFDVTSAPPTAVPDQAGENSNSVLPDLGDLIFDVTGSRPTIPATGGETEAALPKIDGMSFDVATSSPSASAAQPETHNSEQAADGMMEFTLDFPVEDKANKVSPAAQQAEVALAGISLNFDDAAPTAPVSGNKDEHWQEVATKLDLAKAYQEMGDASGAREILEEVLREGDDGQREIAQSLIAQLA